MNGFSLTDINDRSVESQKQDQTAHMSSLILLYTLMIRVNVTIPESVISFPCNQQVINLYQIQTIL